MSNTSPTPSAVAAVAEAGTLVVALDFDGTLADLCDDPMAVRPREGNVELVSRLSALPRTEVVILSGRQLRDLRYLSGMEHAARLVGSHGAEPQDGLALSEAESSLLEALDLRLRDVVAEAGAGDLVWVERKPAARVLHVRLLEDEVRKRRVLDHALSIFRPLQGVHITEGKDIVELAVLDVTKGSYLEAARSEYGADALLFIGDDVTDETVLRTLGNGDLGIKVGSPDDGPSAATAFLPDTAAVTAFLRDFADAREAAASGSPA
ncbi:trehalose-phosphatase [Corynebacterium hansenii]|uniref:Trehalose 6-phosphate phosphatase n=1 Tax=Corynebacterium hansenii TaxID=394964 RepID=A0ABV7ZQK1_9CORY|nr:trehalose-phosphatase [Corynebacterium hansenii]WJZ01009.1 Trehalose-phosphate phosphatase [Corynebacterium hansenii]